ncbi:regulatory protein RecX [Kineosporiaceae bacterium B12]|nr:regulatory protein RecX [Kineococcus rubinsiae]
MAPRSRAQLAEKMAAKDVPGPVSDAVLDRLEEVGLVDDAAFAGALVRTRQRSRGLARRALAQELRTKGVDDDTAAEALAQVTDASEQAAAREVLRRPLAATRGMDPARRQRRLTGALARRGYSAGLAFRLVREALDLEVTGEPLDD